MLGFIVKAGQGTSQSPREQLTTNLLLFASDTWALR